MGNRVVKFRGKRVVSGEWVYGLPVNYCDKTYVLVLTDFEEERVYEAYPHEEMWSYEVIPETVGQNTGLKDRDGVEIYEGDILRNVDNPYVDKLPFKVRWNEYYGAWFWRSLLGEVGTDHLYQHIAKDCEVIGNIYDNPELIGVKNESD